MADAIPETCLVHYLQYGKYINALINYKEDLGTQKAYTRYGRHGVVGIYKVKELYDDNLQYKDIEENTTIFISFTKRIFRTIIHPGEVTHIIIKHKVELEEIVWGKAKIDGDTIIISINGSEVDGYTSTAWSATPLCRTRIYEIDQSKACIAPPLSRFEQYEAGYIIKL